MCIDPGRRRRNRQESLRQKDRGDDRSTLESDGAPPSTEGAQALRLQDRGAVTFKVIAPFFIFIDLHRKERKVKQKIYCFYFTNDFFLCVLRVFAVNN